MTDNEIVEVLKLCTTQDGSIPCYDCPRWNDDEQECEGIDYTATLDLINRQKAEIEKLKGSTIVNNIMESQKIKKVAKAEAYKEFAEKLTSIGKRDGAYDLVSVFEIAELLKEMVGEKE